MRLPFIPREEKFFELFVDDANNVLAGARLLRRHHGGEHDRVFHGADHGAVGLAGDFARFERDLVGAVGKGLLDWVHRDP